MHELVPVLVSETVAAAAAAGNCYMTVPAAY